MITYYDNIETATRVATSKAKGTVKTETAGANEKMNTGTVLYGRDADGCSTFRIYETYANFQDVLNFKKSLVISYTNNN